MASLPLDEKAALAQPPDMQFGEIRAACFHIGEEIRIFDERLDHWERINFMGA
jgi:hypothetical protein